MTDSEAIVETAHALADAARLAILPLFRSAQLTASSKDEAGFDPVTEADRAAESAMRAILAERRPDDGVLGEEFGAVAGISGLTWVLDPIDGTRGFLAGTPTWGVLIGVADATGPLYGIVDQPYIGERFEGGFGIARCVGPGGERALKVGADRPLKEAILFSTYPEIGAPAEREAFAAVADRVRLVRYGMDCYAYALLAGGHVDLVIEAGLQPYDIHAPAALVQAAGGIVTGWDGGPAHDGGRVVAAAGPRQHEAALDILRVCA